MAMLLPTALLMQKLRVSCLSDYDPEIMGVMKRLLLQDSTKTDKSNVINVDSRQSQAEQFNKRSHNITTQGKSGRSKTGYQSESGSLPSRLSSDSDSLSSSSDDDSSTSSSSSGSEES